MHLQDQLVHVGYAEEREDLFIMALPATKCSAKEVRLYCTHVHNIKPVLSQVSQAVRDVVRVLRLQYKTLARAFTAKNAGNLHEFFSIQFLDLLVNIQKLSSVSPARPLLDMSRLLAQHSAKFDQSLPAAHWLHLPEDVKFQVNLDIINCPLGTEFVATTKIFA